METLDPHVRHRAGADDRDDRPGPAPDRDIGAGAGGPPDTGTGRGPTGAAGTDPDTEAGTDPDVAAGTDPDADAGTDRDAGADVHGAAAAGIGARHWWLGGLALLLALALAYAAGYVTPGLRAPDNDSVEAGFARDMSTHHAQAVQMAMIAYRNTDRDHIRDLAYDIATTQQDQIGVMRGWLTQWGVDLNSAEPPMSWMPGGATELHHGLMPGMASPEQIEMLRSATGDRADILFCQLMLRHHLGGIHMVDGVLDHVGDEQVRGLATSMKNNQSGEVEVLTRLLADMGARPL